MYKDTKHFIDQLRSLAKVQDPNIIRHELSQERAEDIADAFQRLSISEGLEIITKLDGHAASAILVELPTETAKQYFAELHDSTLAHYLETLPISDALEMQDELGKEKFEALLEMIPRSSALEIKKLLNYPEGSIGRLLSEHYLSVPASATMVDILNEIREKPRSAYETVDVVYVVNNDGHLVGVISLREILKAAPTETARSVMHTELISTHPEVPAEHAARILVKYNFVALPIIDDRGILLGALMADDAHAVLQEANTEDVLKLGAVTGDVEAYLSLNIFQLMKRRLPWLLALFLAETASGSVLRYYGKGGDDTPKINPVMFFVPLLIGAGGNSGSQTTTTITRALAVGEVTPSDVIHVLGREIGTALLSGGVLALVGFMHAKFVWGSMMNISLCVACALPAIIIWAAIIGSLLPLAAKSVKIDPAVMCAPFITTFVDSTGMIIYFELYRRFVGF